MSCCTPGTGSTGTGNMRRTEILAGARRREARALELRLAGATHEQIGRALGVGRPRAYRVV
jgi:hypothetical protein